jgi:hypothetical protein
MIDKERIEHFRLSQILAVKEQLRHIDSINHFPHTVVGLCERDGVVTTVIIPVLGGYIPKEILLNVITVAVKNMNANIISLSNCYYDNKDENVVVEFTGEIKEKHRYQTLEISSTVGKDGEVTMGNVEILEIKE